MGRNREAIIDVSFRFNHDKSDKSFNNIKSDLHNLGENANIDSNLVEQVNRVEEAVNELQQKVNSIQLGKISSTAFNNAVSEINSAVDSLTKRTIALEALFESAGKGDLLSGIRESLSSVTDTAKGTVDAITKIREAASGGPVNVVDTKALNDKIKKLQEINKKIDAASEGAFTLSPEAFSKRSDEENLAKYEGFVNELISKQEKLSKMKVDDPGYADLAEECGKASKNVSLLYNAITAHMDKQGSSTFAGKTLAVIDDLNNRASKAMSAAYTSIENGVQNIRDELSSLGQNNGKNASNTNISIDFEESTASLKGKLIKMLGALQKVASTHPIEVELNFTSGWATKKNKKLLKEFETKINSLTNETTKEEMEKLVDDISASFGNRLDFEIKSEKLDDTEKKVRAFVDNVKDLLKDGLSIEISKASFSEEVRSTLQDSLNDIAKNLKVVINNVELGENANIPDLQQAISNINKTVSNPRLSDILKQMSEANRDMDNSKLTYTEMVNGQKVVRYRTSKERKLFVNSETGWIGNPFYVGEREGAPRYNKQVAEAMAQKANVGIHTHPHAISAMSYHSMGDFSSFYTQLIDNEIKKQIVSSSKDAEIFDVEGFFSKYSEKINFKLQSVWDELAEAEKGFHETYSKIPKRDKYYNFIKDQMTDEDYDTLITDALSKYALQKDVDVVKKKESIKAQLDKFYSANENADIYTAITQLFKDTLSDKHIQRMLSRKDVSLSGAITDSLFKIISTHGYDGQDAYQDFYGKYMPIAVENAWGKYSKGIGKDLVDNFIKIVPSETLDEVLGISGVSQAASDATASVKTLGEVLQEIVDILSEIKTGSNFAEMFKGVFDESSELKTFLESLKNVSEVVDRLKSSLSSTTAEEPFGDVSGVSTTIEKINDELTTLVSIIKNIPEISERLRLDDIFSGIAEFTEELDDINLKDENIKKTFKSIVSDYWNYVKLGGTRSITELTDNESAQKKLENGYKSYLKQHPLPDVDAEAKAQSAQIRESIKLISTAVDELRTSVGSGFGEIFNGDNGFKDAVSGIHDVGNALYSLLEVIEKFTGISSSATLDKLFFNLGFETETMGDVDARTKAFKNIIKQYDEYAKAGGTRDISDLTSDEDVKKKLSKSYANYIKQQQKAEEASRAAVKARESAMKAEEEEIASFGAVAVPVDEVDEKNDKLQKSFEEVVNGIKNVQTAISALKDSLNFSEGVTGINTLVSSMENLIALLEKMSGFKSKATLDNMFSTLSETTKTQNNLKANSKIFKDILKQYDEYVNLGGTKNITELTDDANVQKKLSDGYANYIKNQQKAAEASKEAAAAAEQAKTSESGEAGALGNVGNAASQAAKAKEIFAKANQLVSASAKESANSVDAEGNGMSSVAKIASQMHEANILMGQQEDKNKSRERGFYFNTKTGRIGNPFLVGETTSFPGYKLNNTGMNAELHTHPTDVAALSIIKKENNKYYGDLFHFLGALQKGIYTQIVSGLEESQIVDVKGFFEKYGEKLNFLKTNTTDAYNIFNELKEKYINPMRDSFIENDIGGFFDTYLTQLIKDGIITNDDQRKLIKSLNDEASIYNNGDLTKYLLDKFKTAKSLPENKGSFKNTFDSIFYRPDADNELKDIFKKITDGGGKSMTATLIKSLASIDSERDRIFRDVITPKFFDKILGEGAGEDFMKNYQRVVKTKDLDEALGMKGISAQSNNLIEVSSLVKDISAILSGFGDSAKGFDALNKIINNLGGKNGDAKLQSTVEGLRQIFEILNTPMSESSMMEAITKIADSGEKLKDLSTVLKSTKKDLDNASKVVAGENQPNVFTEEEFEKERRIIEEGKKYLSNYGQVLDVVLSRGKNGMTNLVSKIMGEDPNTHEKKIQEVKLTTADGRYFTRDYIKQNTADLAKYMMQMQRAKEFAESRMKFGTEEVFLKDETDEETWQELISFASQYADQLGNIQRITRQTRQDASGKLLESFTFVGDKGHLTMGRELGDIVATSQKYTDPKEIEDSYNRLTKSVNAYVDARMDLARQRGDFGDTAAINEIDTMVNKLAADTQEANEKMGSMQNIAQAAKTRYENALSGAYDNYINDYINKSQKQIDTAQRSRSNQRNAYTEDYIQQLKTIEENQEKLKTIRGQHANGELWNNDELEETVRLMTRIDQLLPGLKNNENILARTDEVDVELSKLNKDLADNSISGELLERYMTLINYLNRVRVASEDAADGLSQINKIEMGNVKAEVKDLHNQMIQTGQYGKNFWKQMTGAISSQSANFLATYFSLQDIIRYAREIASNVTTIDSALIELQKVSDASDKRIEQSFSKSAATAQEMGATISEVINSTSDWARQGFSVDDAEELARVTQLYQNVGDNISQEEASKSLVSTLQGFQLGADQAESVIDKFNEVANNFSIDTYGIGQALERSAASFYASGTDLSKAVALVTTANTVLQNPESVGM